MIIFTSLSMKYFFSLRMSASSPPSQNSITRYIRWKTHRIMYMYRNDPKTYPDVCANTGLCKQCHVVQAQSVHLINKRICYSQQQNILLKRAYFVVMINNRMDTTNSRLPIFVAFCCWSSQHSVVDSDNKIGTF